MKHIFRMACLAPPAFLVVLALGGCSDQGKPGSQSAITASAPAASSAAAVVPEGAHFTITGHALQLKDGTKITLLEMDAHPDKMDSSMVLDTATVRDGSFELTGSVDQPMRGVVSWGSHASTSMIIENTTYQLVDTGAGLAVKGGHYNDLAYGYRWQPDYVAALKKEKVASRKAFAHVDAMDEAAMTAARKAVAPSRKAVRAIKNAYQARILDGNGPVLLKTFVLPDNYDWERYDPAKRKAMYATYAETLGPNPVLQRVHYAAKVRQESKAARNALDIGKPYRDIVAVGADGKKVKLSDVLGKNKLVLLDFWASWCGPCRAEFPHLAKTYKEFHKEGFEIYAVSLDDSADDWHKALEEEAAHNNIPWINLRDPGFGSQSSRTYGVLGLPSNFLISGDGTIVGKNMQDWGVEHAVRKQFEKLNHGKG